MIGRSMAHEADPRSQRLRLVRLLQVRLSRLMVLIALVAVLFSAWLYHRANRSDQQAWTSGQLSALSDPDAMRRRQAAENLYRVEPDNLARTVAALAGALGDPDRQVRRAAARTLPTVIRAAIGSSGAVTNGDWTADFELALRALTLACHDPRNEVQIEARRAVGTLFETAHASGSAPRVPLSKTATKEALDAMSRGMYDESPEVRAQALWSFARIGPIAGAGADPVKVIAESDPERSVQIAAIHALSEGWPADPHLYSLLLRRLKVVSDQEELSHIGWALGGLAAPPPFEIIPALLDALSTENWILRRSIPDALGKLGPAGRAALPALARLARIEMAADFGECPAIKAIRLIAPSSSEAQALIVPLVTLLRDSPSAMQRQEAMFLLAGFGTSAATAVGPLRDALKSANPDVRSRASYILRYVGSAAISAIPDLDNLVRTDPDPNVQRSAEYSSRKIKALVPISAASEP
jgi:HEAT repeat protein